MGAGAGRNPATTAGHHCLQSPQPWAASAACCQFWGALCSNSSACAWPTLYPPHGMVHRDELLCSRGMQADSAAEVGLGSACLEGDCHALHDLWSIRPHHMHPYHLRTVTTHPHQAPDATCCMNLAQRPAVQAARPSLHPSALCTIICHAWLFGDTRSARSLLHRERAAEAGHHSVSDPACACTHAGKLGLY